MSNRLLIITFLFYLFSVGSHAQSKTEDILYLKNGEVVKGKITEIISDSIIKIQTKERNIFVYKYNEVQKILREHTPLTNNDTSSIHYYPDPKPQFKEAGYYAIIKFGPGNKSSNYHIINGYQFNPYLLLGFGIGLDAYAQLGDSLDFNPYNGGSHSRLMDYFMPIFIDMRCQITGKSRATVVTFMDLGYSVYMGGKANQKNYKAAPYGSQSNSFGSFKPVSGGAFLYTGIGVRVFIAKRIAVISDLGLKIQAYTASQFNSDYYNGIPSPNSKETRTILVTLTPALNIGVMF
jgi:sRNA-binding regulator protein Hfq